MYKRQSLWLGAIERFFSSNIKNIGAIHRGFSTYEKTKYRNNPEWQIAIDLQRRLPDLPLILDPSHIAGRRDLIFDLCQTALDLNYDGLMIESHNDPENAWSDAKQQITPEKLKELTMNLKVRRITNNDEVFLEDLDNLRAQINVHELGCYHASLDVEHIYMEHHLQSFQFPKYQIQLGQQTQNIKMGGRYL